MMALPDYFDEIRDRAAKRWDQLEADRELAGPWHQLFQQVQNPRHVLSELLQNADDAGATEASVRIENDCFVFLHNGADFTEENFTSLCRFGYSNKRALHTIGFRGIGFKSVFSLGDSVELRTPTLSVAFDRERFTEPRWVHSSIAEANTTRISVAIRDEHRERELAKNLDEWRNNPVSLLFFKNVLRLRISDHSLYWTSAGSGPVPDTEWMALEDTSDKPILVGRSREEPFPADVLAEIKAERLLGMDQETEFPPCKVEIVLGAKGRLYVVLPTGVETNLPFACNAPFIQDPARLKIKNPEISPTNRWLLDRLGALAASIMLQWLGRSSIPLVERSRAYGLFPDVDRTDGSLEGACAAAIEDAFEESINGQTFLLTDVGNLKPAKQSIIMPEELLDIWPAEQAVVFFDSWSRPALSRHVSDSDRDKLISWGVTERISKEHVFSVLQAKHLPKPKSWRQLLKLWAYVAPEITGWSFPLERTQIRIVPVQGKDVLYGAAEVVRLGEKRLLKSEADWEFLAAYLLVLNQNWPRFLVEQRRSLEESSEKGLDQDTAAALAVLKILGIEDSSDANEVIEQVAEAFFGQQQKPISKCVQFAQIAAKLGAKVGEAFRFATRDLRLRSCNHAVLFDPNADLQDLLPAAWCSEHVLHAEYSKSFDSCSPEEWRQWISSGHSGLCEFVPFRQNQSSVWSRQQIEAELRKRGSRGVASYPYKTSNFLVEDWDFEGGTWRHWLTLAKDDAKIWGRIVGHITAQPEDFWTSAKSARVLQVATTGSQRAITYEPLLPAWILKFRDLPCLSDTRGFYHKPGDLLRRTPETESLMDVEPFVHGLLDTETTRPLLTLLGVRDTPTGPDRLLDCLRALARTDKPPVHEVEKWYRRLDRMVDACSTADFATIAKTFREERIVLTEMDGWVTTLGVFLWSDEENVPGAAVIRAAVRDLTLWRKIGVADRPTADLAIRWLKNLPPGKPLSPDDARRVRALLARHAMRIWYECGHWLNLAREWVPVASLECALTMQSLVEWSHLHEWVRQRTADFRLPVEITQTLPFSGLPLLIRRIEDRIHHSHLSSRSLQRHDWLRQLGIELCRIELDDEAETTRVRVFAANLAETDWKITPKLEIIPYIDGAPAGTPRHADVVWLDRVLYVDDLSKAKLARLVPDQLGKIFGQPDITVALIHCFDRSAEDVTKYVEANFKLTSRETVTPPAIVVGTPADEGAVEDKGVTAEQETAIETTDLYNGDEARDGPDDHNLPRPKDRVHAKPTLAPLIDRFAKARGFKRVGEDRFVHADGSWIAKAHDGSFPWERGTAAGDVIRHYWLKDHCLQHGPLQLDADVWGLIDRAPEMYALILADSDGEPVEMLGSHLRAMRTNGDFTLFPATYRLVLNPDRNQRAATG